MNKADRDGADRTVRDLQAMLEVRHAVGHVSPAGGAWHAPGDAVARPVEDLAWYPPIVLTVAVKGEGVAELVAAIASHRAHLEKGGALHRREVARARAGFLMLLRDRLLAGALEQLEEETGQLDEVAGRIARREADPYALADDLAGRLRARSP